jgi:hypothetical protein
MSSYTTGLSGKFWSDERESVVYFDMLIIFKSGYETPDGNLRAYAHIDCSLEPFKWNENGEQLNTNIELSYVEKLKFNFLKCELIETNYPQLNDYNHFISEWGFNPFQTFLRHELVEEELKKRNLKQGQLSE